MQTNYSERLNLLAQIAEAHGLTALIKGVMLVTTAKYQLCDRAEEEGYEKLIEGLLCCADAAENMFDN